MTRGRCLLAAVALALCGAGEAAAQRPEPAAVEALHARLATADLELRRGQAGARLLIESRGHPAIELVANDRALRLDAPEDSVSALALGNAPRDRDRVQRLRLRLLDAGTAIVRLRLDRP